MKSSGFLAVWVMNNIYSPTRAVTLNFGMQMPAWYDLYGLTPNAEEDEEGIAESAMILHSMIDAVSFIIFYFQIKSIMYWYLVHSHILFKDICYNFFRISIDFNLTLSCNTFILKSFWIFQEIESGIPSDRIMIGGFSMGGALALYAGLIYDKPLAGIIGLSSFLVQRTKLPGVMLTRNSCRLKKNYSIKKIILYYWKSDLLVSNEV